MAEPVVRIPDAKVALSTASVYPESTATAFEIAARLGYDGVEVMVWTDPVSQDIEALRRLSDYHQIPILAVHAPCLLITQRVWSTDPWTKLQRAQAAAEKLGATTVVVHPPFRWQRQYARDFVTGIWRMADETDVRFARREHVPLALPRPRDARVRPRLGRHEGRLPALHDRPQRTPRRPAATPWRWSTAWATASATSTSPTATAPTRTSTWSPAAARSPAPSCSNGSRVTGFDGHVVIEVNTRRAMSGAEREADLAEALAFTRLHLASSVRAVPGRGPRP